MYRFHSVVEEKVSFWESKIYAGFPSQIVLLKKRIAKPRIAAHQQFHGAYYDYYFILLFFLFCLFYFEL